MKVVISGPRGMPPRDGTDWPHMHIETELPALPAEGEVIIVNNGSAYRVRRRMWWVDTPRDEAYWARGDWDAKGKYQTAYLDVMPADYDEPFTADKMLAEGQVRGREQAMTEVEQLLDYESDVPQASVIALLRRWCTDGAAAARQRAEENARKAALVATILDQLQGERETSDG